MVVPHIYGARVIFVLFCDQQDTESDSWGIRFGVPVPISTHKKNSNALWANTIHTLYHIGVEEQVFT